MFKTPRSQLRGKQALVENSPEVMRLEAMEMGPPQTFVWLIGLVTLNGFLMDVIEVGIAELVAPEAEYAAEAVIPDEFEDPLDAAWTFGRDPCGKEAKDEETAGEAAEGKAEGEVVKPFTLKDSDEPLGLLAEL
ncbi:MAG: hypothetical protein Q9161_000451 [Pseudevernia consocians]